MSTANKIRDDDRFGIGDVIIKPDGQMVTEFITDVPHHRHFDITFWRGDNPALDAAVAALGEALVAAAQQFMFDMLGDVSAPEPIEFQPLRVCRICGCRSEGPADDWQEVCATTPDTPSKWYCPEHHIPVAMTPEKLADG